MAKLNDVSVGLVNHEMAKGLFMNKQRGRARNRLPKPSGRATAEDTVVVTRHRTPLVETQCIEDRGRPMTEADVEYFREHRVGRKRPKLNAAELVSRLRDEEWR